MITFPTALTNAMAPQGAAAPSGPRAGSTKRMSLHDFRALVAESKAPGKALSEKSFVAKYGYGYDACILFDYDDRKLKGKVPLGVAKTLAKLKKGGVEASWHVTSTRTACVVLLRATVHRLARYADDVDWPMPLDEAECARRAAAGDAEHGIKPFDIFHDPRVTRGLRPFQSLFGKYDTDPSLQALYATPRGGHHCFSSDIVRLKLLFAILERKQSEGGCGLDVDKMVLDKEILDCYPLHVDRKRDAVKRAFSMIHYDACADVVRNYCGARVAMYLGFLAHLVRSMEVVAVLSVLATFGLWAEVALVDRKRKRSRVLPVFACVQCIWAMTMLSGWTRREFAYALRWGMLGKDAEPDRPEFFGETRNSLTDGRPETYFPVKERRRRVRFSAVVLVACILVVLVFAMLPIVVRVFREEGPRVGRPAVRRRAPQQLAAERRRRPEHAAAVGVVVAAAAALGRRRERADGVEVEAPRRRGVPVDGVDLRRRREEARVPQEARSASYPILFALPDTSSVVDDLLLLRRPLCVGSRVSRSPKRWRRCC